MKITVLSVTRSHLDKENPEIKNENMPVLLENLKRFAGAEAGICYMSKPYFDSYVSDELKAEKRFVTVANTNHHSIAGHSQVGLLLEDIPKIVVMFLNNLGDYETSEKSGRYTVMTGNTEREVELYEKWCKKLNQAIFDMYGDKIDERTRDKLAKENARYLLSVFTPTTLGYTTSIRQFNYIIDWAKKYSENNDLPDNYFFNTLKEYMAELSQKLSDLLYVKELRDPKGREFDMIEPTPYIPIKFQYGKQYTVGYWASFPEFAQGQRHRTLTNNFQFDGISKRYIVPEVIRGTELEPEWVEDMRSVAEYIPNGTLVYAIESGGIDKFFLKSLERNCGRAQLEIMKQNLETSQKFMDNIDKFPEKYQELIRKYHFENGTPKMKGQCLKCAEPCVWGCAGAATRKI